MEKEWKRCLSSETLFRFQCLAALLSPLFSFFDQLLRCRETKDDRRRGNREVPCTTEGEIGFAMVARNFSDSRQGWPNGLLSYRPCPPLAITPLPRSGLDHSASRLADADLTPPSHHRLTPLLLKLHSWMGRQADKPPNLVTLECPTPRHGML